MRNIHLTFILFFSVLLFNCKDSKVEQQLSAKIIKNEATSEINEFFSLVKPINKPEEPSYKTIYGEYSISMNSNSSNQELIFTKGNSKISKVLKFYYENPETVFHLYKSNFDNIILLIEGRDYYGSNLGIYYLENTLNEIIEIDDTIIYKQDDPENKGFKLPKAEITKKGDELKCKIYLGDKFLYDKNYTISNKIKIEKDETSKKNTINDTFDQYNNNVNYFIKTFDVNKDGIDDKIVSHNRYKGDELLVFIGDKSNNFNFALKTINFSQDGGNQISNIKITQQGFRIITSFPDKGQYEGNYYVVFKNNTFILQNVETVATSLQDDSVETCTLNNLEYNLNKPIDGLLNILAKSKKNCKKTKL